MPGMTTIGTTEQYWPKGASPHQRVAVVLVVVELVEPVMPPVAPELELEPVPPVEPGPPIELVPPLVPPAVLPGWVEGGVVPEELVDPVAPVEPVVPSRLLQAPSERAATTAKVAAAH